MRHTPHFADDAPRLYGETPSQTAGPYVHIGLAPAAAGVDGAADWATGALEGAGEPIAIDGVVYDGAGAPVKDALLEIHQADGEGRLPGPDFRGWARASADFETGLFRFRTIKPASLPWRAPDGAERVQAPHVSLLLFARGINIHLHTRIYFPEDAAAHAADPALARIEQVDRRRTLIAAAAGPSAYRFDVRLQGDGETVFFDM